MRPKEVVTKSKPKPTPTATVLPEIKEETSVLAESMDMGKSYVDETLFLGDSNTVRFMQFSDESGQTFTTKNNTIAVVGMGVNAIESLACMQFSTGTFTMVNAVGILQPRRIMMTFGTNNLSGYDTEDAKVNYINTYVSEIQKVHDAYPYADIIINSIPPLASFTVYRNLSNEQIYSWNEALKQMCEEHKWHYLNSYEVLADQDTHVALDGMMDTDGLHFSRNGIATLFTYFRTHALETEDTRPSLVGIPTIIGPLTNLYNTNPLTGKQFDDSVYHPAEATTVPEPTPVVTTEPEVEPIPEEPVTTPVPQEEPVPQVVEPEPEVQEETPVEPQ